jgi:hypothetical protein
VKPSSAVMVCAAAVMFSMCRCSSPLSDVDITDFGVIGMSASIDKWFCDTGISRQEVRAFVYDKNLASVRIKNGGVMINGTAMAYDSTVIMPCYRKDDIQVTPQTAYRFVITISNGDRCTSTVVTPPAEFGTVTVPDTVHISNGTTITWTAVAQGSPVDITLTQVTGSRTVFQRSGVPDSGRIVIPPSADTTLAGKARFEMKRSTVGTIAGQLRDGTVRSQFSFSDSLTLAQ